MCGCMYVTSRLSVDAPCRKKNKQKKQVPFVGFNVVKQAECMASHGVFIGIQVGGDVISSCTHNSS